MTWVKLDDAFGDHPKILGLSDSAFRLHVLSLCYSARYLTDGNVPTAFVRGHGEDADELWRAGLWFDNGDGYEIHDYLAYNPSREDVRHERERVSARVARFRGRTNPQSNGSSNGKGNGVTNTVPVPVPQPHKTKALDLSSFETFWAAYPRKASKQGAKSKFQRLIEKGVRAADLIAGAERYRDDPNRENEFTKLPTTWLNGGCWEDEPLPSRQPRRAVEGTLDRMAREAMEGMNAEQRNPSSGSDAPRALPG